MTEEPSFSYMEKKTTHSIKNFSIAQLNAFHWCCCYCRWYFLFSPKVRFVLCINWLVPAKMQLIQFNFPLWIVYSRFFNADAYLCKTRKNRKVLWLWTVILRLLLQQRARKQSEIRINESGVVATSDSSNSSTENNRDDDDTTAFKHRSNALCMWS